MGTVSVRSPAKKKSPSAISRCKVRPTRRGSWLGCRPRPGDFTVTSSAVIVAPACSGRAATRDLARLMRFIASPVETTRSVPTPIDSSMSRVCRTICANSSGSRETLWSLPSSPRSTVKCFSMIAAPRATAASATWKPRSWPE